MNGREETRPPAAGLVPVSDGVPEPAAPGRGAWWKAALGYLLALAALVWVFHDVRLPELRADIAGIRWTLVPVAIVVDLLSYVCQGLRWRLLLHPVGKIRVIRATQAIYAGLFVNEMLPMRLGELLRGYLAARRLGTGFGRVFPSIVVERFLDGVWLALSVGLIAVLVRFPRDLAVAADILGIAVVVGTLVFLAVVLRAERNAPAAGPDPEMSTGREAEPSAARVPETSAGRVPETSSARRSVLHGGAVSRLAGALGRLASGIRAIGLSRYLAGAFAATGFLFLFQGTAYWIVLRACGIHLPLPAGLAVFLLVYLGTAIPNAPGNVGSYQFFTVLGLALFGVEKSSAAAFSLVVFILLTVPLWGFGWLALSRSGLGLRTVREEIARARGGAPARRGS